MIALAAVACKRVAPEETGSFLLEFRMPDDCIPSAYYSGAKVSLKGAMDYEFETDVRGMVNVPSVVPGIYNIITNVEMSGAEYKKLLNFGRFAHEPAHL